jgi:lipopolysaccharide/colanic/teichoic acid biosynthesis glycosyltransferase
MESTAQRQTITQHAAVAVPTLKRRPDATTVSRTAKPVAPEPFVPAAVEPSWQAVLDELRRRGAHRAAIAVSTRLFEIVVASVLLVVTLPLMALIAVIVRLDSPGPVVFRQARVGRDGRLFKFAKFRTLYVDARQRWPHLYAYRYTADEVAALHFKLKNDPRVTRVGRWLRKSTLDELPNLWNVLTGDVALVGPRPEIPEMLPYYDDVTLAKFSVRPGVTGLAQVRGRGDLSFRDTVALDVEYVRTRSLRLDVEILLSTVICTVLRKGAF